MTAPTRNYLDFLRLSEREHCAVSNAAVSASEIQSTKGTQGGLLGGLSDLDRTQIRPYDYFFDAYSAFNRVAACARGVPERPLTSKALLLPLPPRLLPGGAN
jgi:hypothetical protein